MLCNKYVLWVRFGEADFAEYTSQQSTLTLLIMYYCSNILSFISGCRICTQTGFIILFVIDSTEGAGYMLILWSHIDTYYYVFYHVSKLVIISFSANINCESNLNKSQDNYVSLSHYSCEAFKQL